MFGLFLLLLVPLGIAGICCLISHLSHPEFTISWKEILVQELVVLIIATTGFFIAKSSRTRDIELLNGAVVKKVREKVPCTHSYSCPPCWETCSGEGASRVCTEHCSTCYEHDYDIDWAVYIDYGMLRERIEIRRLDRQGLKEPPRWTIVEVGDPTSRTHNFENYIKACPDSILRRTGNMEKFQKMIPAYPVGIYDYYHVNRFLTVGVPVPEPVKKWWNKELMKINSNLGPKKQVNVIIVAVNTLDHSYVHALEEAWIGGKKNDFIVVLGITNYPNIDWVRTVSWTSKKDLMVEVRDGIGVDIKTLERKEDITTLIHSKIEEKFVRRKMAEFDFLKASIKPTKKAMIILWVITLILTIGMTIFFWVQDPFDDGHHFKRRYY